ncbi:MAG TPA: hypothetical protein DCS29_01025 [Candidatus Magasanikbacteria bacterium]|nr:MAG: hypothetical protein A2479_04650 [Candidatus Magasanikbacteria bacterium RIFOXYC2_FULL_39_8]HAT03346.1 hypothetical protein [Candidatus Magasanikbacteria bacterium]
MQFVEKHLTKHHLFHAPHKWFFAFLSSPIHFAELHYKKKYHLKFVHAKKLFVFDMLLLLSTVAIFISAIFWWAYDPTLTDLIYITIEPTKSRIISGEQVGYRIVYKNESDVGLFGTTLTLATPEGFVETQVVPFSSYYATAKTFSINELKPQEWGEIYIEGMLYGTPHKETPLQAILEYTQEGRQKKERKISPHVTIVRGSLLKTTIDASTSALNDSTTPLHITLTNTGEVDFPLVSVPIPLPQGLTLKNPRVDFGKIKENLWDIGTLVPGQTATLDAMIDIHNPQTQEIILEITPQISLTPGQSILQETQKHTLTIVYPHLSVSSSWSDNRQSSRPGETPQLIYTLYNDSNTTLSDIELHVPLTAGVVHTNQFGTLNKSLVTNGTGILTKNNIPELSLLIPGQRVTVPLYVPIVQTPQNGTDIILNLTPEIYAHVSGVEHATYTTQTQSPKLAIGTQILLNSQLRYYTNEGDQLGRGPLPPQVGKETKYWAMIQMTNTTSRIENLMFKAQLPSYATWTGKTSVTHGSDVSYNPQTRQISWSLSNLGAHTTAGIYFELAFTPIESQQNTSPVLLQNISLNAQDGYIQVPIYKTSNNLDISIPADTIGKEKGTVVE